MKSCSRFVNSALHEHCLYLTDLYQKVKIQEKHVFPQAPNQDGGKKKSMYVNQHIFHSRCVNMVV